MLVSSLATIHHTPIRSVQKLSVVVVVVAVVVVVVVAIVVVVIVIVVVVVVVMRARDPCGWFPSRLVAEMLSHVSGMESPGYYMTLAGAGVVKLNYIVG